MNYYQLMNIKNLLGRNLYFYFALFITLAITGGSLISVKSSALEQLQLSDKFVHVLAYIVLTLGWILTFKLKIRVLKNSILLALIVFVYGIVIEVYYVRVTHSLLLIRVPS